MIKILIFEPSLERREQLMPPIRAQLNARGMLHVEFACFEPGDVFLTPMPVTAWAAFFTLGSMYDVEAARHFSKLRGEIPLAVISDSDEYGLEGYSFAVYYLLRPFSGKELDSALRKCRPAEVGFGHVI